MATINLPDIGTTVLRILSESNTSQNSIQSLIDEFAMEFSSISKKFHACSVIRFFLENPGYLISSSQKVGAISLLLGAYEKETLRDNPFATLFPAWLSSEVTAVASPIGNKNLDFNKPSASTQISLNNIERRMISSLVAADKSSQIWSQRIPTLIQSIESGLKSESSLADPDLSSILRNPDGFGQYPPLIKTNTVFGYFNDPEKLSFGNYNPATTIGQSLADSLPIILKDDGEDKKNGDVPLPFRTFVPPRMICAPPFHVAEDEMVWLNPDSLELDFYQNLVLATSDSNPTTPDDTKLQEGGHTGHTKSEAELLIKHAFKEALTMAQRQSLLNLLDVDPTLAHNLKVTPDVLPDLVENNPIVAIDMLLKMIDSAVDMKDHLTALIEMDMSVHSMEVVNRLTSSVELPKEFLYLYISNCIKTCESIQDKYVQNRLVRLLCVFLQSLIRNQIIDFQYLYIEILTFCVEFSRIREAAALYKLMKQVESEDPELSEVLLKKLELHQHLSEAAKNFPTKDKDNKM